MQCGVHASIMPTLRPKEVQNKPNCQKQKCIYLSTAQFKVSDNQIVFLSYCTRRSSFFMTTTTRPLFLDRSSICFGIASHAAEKP